MGWIPDSTATWYMESYWKSNPATDPNGTGAWRISYKNDNTVPVTIVGCKFSLVSANSGYRQYRNSGGIGIADGRGCLLTARINDDMCGSEDAIVIPRQPNCTGRSNSCGCDDVTDLTCKENAYHTGFGPKFDHTFTFPDCPDILPNETIQLTIRAHSFGSPAVNPSGGTWGTTVASHGYNSQGCTVVTNPAGFIESAEVIPSVPKEPPIPETKYWNINFHHNLGDFSGGTVTYPGNTSPTFNGTGNPGSPSTIQRARAWSHWSGTNPNWIENWIDPTYGPLPWQPNIDQDNIVRTGYIFRGWQTTPLNGLLKPQTDTITSDVTLYARWERIVNIWEYNGASWVLTKATGRHNGSQFARDVNLLKRYNGSSWVDPFGNYRNY